jgi:hypothetical protein
MMGKRIVLTVTNWSENHNMAIKLERKLLDEGFIPLDSHVAVGGSVVYTVEVSGGNPENLPGLFSSLGFITLGGEKDES